jgi:methyl-accepting chemotaxis protein
MDADLLILTGLDGIPLLALGPALEEGVNDLTPLSTLARRAVRGGSSDGFFVLGGGLAYVTAMQLEIGGMELGTLCLGSRIDARLLDSLEKMTGSGTVLIAEERVTAQSHGVPLRAGIALRKTWNELSEALPAENRTRAKIEGAHYRSLWVPLRSADGDVLGAFVALRSEDRALAFLAGVHRGLLGIAMAAILVAMFFSYLLAREITLPVQKLVALTKRVSRGDLDWRVHLGTRDELATLGDSFNQMAKVLSESRQTEISDSPPDREDEEREAA